MHNKAYISNLSPSWPPERQEEVLAASVPGWPVATFRDELGPRALRDRDTERLAGRLALVRETTRKGRTMIHVASLAVLEFRVAGFRAWIGSLANRQFILMAHAEGERYDLSIASDRDRAAKRFPISRTRVGRDNGLALGTAISAQRRKDASDAAIEGIKPFWGHPGYTQKGLVAQAGITINTAVSRLKGWRRAAQRLERKAERERAKAAQENKDATI